MSAEDAVMSFQRTLFGRMAIGATMLLSCQRTPVTEVVSADDAMAKPKSSSVSSSSDAPSPTARLVYRPVAPDTIGDCRAIGGRTFSPHHDSVVEVTAAGAIRHAAPGLVPRGDGESPVWTVGAGRLFWTTPATPNDLQAIDLATGGPSSGLHATYPIRGATIVAGDLLLRLHDVKCASGTPSYGCDALVRAPVGGGYQTSVLPLHGQRLQRFVLDGPNVYWWGIYEKDIGVFHQTPSMTKPTRVHAVGPSDTACCFLTVSEHDLWFTDNGLLWKLPTGSAVPIQVWSHPRLADYSPFVVAGGKAFIGLGVDLVELDLATKRTTILARGHGVSMMSGLARAPDGAFTWCGSDGVFAWP